MRIGAISVLNEEYFHDEAASFAMVESIVWADGPVCPHCGGKDRIYTLAGIRSKPSKKNPQGVVRHGLKKCGTCRKQFTVRIGTVFESSHIPLHYWLQAFHLLCSSKNGISSHQLHRILGIKYQSAWFMSHRIREAMRTGSLAAPMGGDGSPSNVVEIDETYIGKKEGAVMKSGGSGHKRAVVTLVNRLGEARSFHVDKANKNNVMPIVRENIAAEGVLFSDETRIYDDAGNEVMHHAKVNHFRHQYVNPARTEFAPFDAIHTNTVEGYFSIFKRGMKGVYQHCAEKHLHRYLAEFDFRYSNRVKMGVDDKERTIRALEGVKGKRLTYSRSSDA